MGKDVDVVEVDQDRIDRIIWRHIGLKPVSWIAEQAGVRPDEVLRRKTELLEGIDVLSIQEKRTKLLIELDEVVARARERFETASDEFSAGLLNSAIAGVKTILVELARMEAKDSDAVEKLNNLRIRELMRLVDGTVSATLREIAGTYDLDEAELMEIFQEHLVEEARASEERK